MDSTTILAFATTSMAILIIPGPTIMAVVSYAIHHGYKACFTLVCAVALGDATALALSILGLGSLLATSVALFNGVKIAGAVYLLYLGITLLRKGRKPIEKLTATDKFNTQALFLNTYMITALNPKGIVFFVAFLPQFVNPNQEAAPQLLILACSFVTLAIINTLAYALFASSATGLFKRKGFKQKLDMASGGVLSTAGFITLISALSSSDK